MAVLSRSRVDPRSVPAGRVGGWLFTAAFAVVAGGGALVALTASGAPLVSWAASGAIAAAVLGGLGFLAHTVPAIAWRTTYVTLDEDGLEYEHGWLWRHHVSVPRARIQHTDVTQGPLERRFGIATLVVYTAGTEHAAIPIAGLAHDVALRLRDALLARGAAEAAAAAPDADAV